MSEEVGEEDGGADGTYYGVGSGETSGSPELAASAVEGRHIGDGNIAEGVDDGVAAAAASAGLAEELERYGGEHGIAGADGEEVERCSDEVGEGAQRAEPEERQGRGVYDAERQVGDRSADAGGDEGCGERTGSHEEGSGHAVHPGDLLSADVVVLCDAGEEADGRSTGMGKTIMRV